MANVIGPDVSVYQDEPSTPQGIDFVKMRQNAEFVIIRAGQNLWVDSDFKTNWTDSKTAGLPRGSYWFYDSRADPKLQAELWIEQLTGDLGELPLFADLEETYNGPFKGWQKWMDFLERLKALAPRKEIFIYTAFYYWRDNAPNPQTQPDKLEYFHQYPLWIANYGTAQPSIPKPWRANEWIFWQYTKTGDGKLFGVESKEIDLNYFNGDKPAFLKRFGLSDPTPTQKFIVDLNVRDGSGTTYASLGTLKHKEVVEKLETSADSQWIKIRRDDGLTGWSLSNYLVPKPDSGGGIIDMTGKWFRVTAAILNMRAGPGETFNIVGTLQLTEAVEALKALTDLSWIEVRRSDGLTGWCSGTYLVSIPPPPPPSDRTLTWYRNTLTLNVREGAGTNFKSIGYFLKDEIIYSREATTDGSWVLATRFDGLSGWCSAARLIKLGETAPSQLTQKIYNGVTYYRKETLTPRKMVTHVLVVDMNLTGLLFLVTPPSDSSGVICSRTTSKFLSEFAQRIAINGDGFSYLDPATYPPQGYCPNGGDPVKVNGYAASRGTVYSTKVPGQPTIYINQNNVITFDVLPDRIFNAVSGDRMVVVKGQAISTLNNATLEPRTALGLNSNGRWLMLVVVDGRQPGYSEGITIAELASLMISLDIYNGIIMDGGGSSTMVIEGANGLPFVLNSPIDESTVGKEREIANHLGIFVKK